MANKNSLNFFLSTTEITEDKKDVNLVFVCTFYDGLVLKAPLSKVLPQINVSKLTSEDLDRIEFANSKQIYNFDFYPGEDTFDMLNRSALLSLLVPQLKVAAA